MKLPTQKQVLTSLNRYLSLFSEQTFNYAKTTLWTKESLKQLQQASLLCLKSLHLISLVMITICIATVYLPLLASNKAIDFVEKRANLTTATKEGSSGEAFTQDSTKQSVDHTFLDSTEEVKVQDTIIDKQNDCSVFTFSNIDSSEAVLSSTTELLYNSQQPLETTFSAMFKQTKQEDESLSKKTRKNKQSIPAGAL